MPFIPAAELLGIQNNKNAGDPEHHLHRMSYDDKLALSLIFWLKLSS